MTGDGPVSMLHCMGAWTSQGGGVVGARIRAHDWASSPLGPHEAWPKSLLNTLDLMLASPHAMFLSWGPEQICFFNDAYRPVLGARDETALGMKFPDLWPELWDELEPFVRKALAGEASRFEDHPLTMTRYGHDEQTWWTFSYSPVRDDDGRIAGMFCVTMETTQKVLLERQRLDEMQRFQDLFEQSPSFVAALEGPEHRFYLANPAYRRLIGDRDVVGLTVREALPELAGQGFYELLDEVYRTGEPYSGFSVPVTLQHPGEAEPQQRYLDFVYQPIRNVAGQVQAIFVQGTDVTAGRGVLDALRQSELRLERAQQAGGVGIFSLDIADSTLHGSAEFCRIFGLAECQGVHAGEIEKLVVAEDAALASSDARRRDASAPLDVEYRIRRADTGEVRWIARKAEYECDEAGTPVRLVGVVQDITERRAAQRKLEETAAALADLNATLEHQVEERTRERDRAWKYSQDLQLVTSAEGIFSAANEAWTAILGWRPEEVVGRHHLDFIHPEDHPSGEANLDVAANGELPVSEIRMLHKDGTYRWISWVAAPADGVIYASGRHITAEKEAAAQLAAAQEQLRQSQKLEAVGQLTGGVAHDFNNLLTIIRSAVDLMRRRDLPEERRSRYVDAIAETVDRASKLTGQLLAFARRQPLKPEVFDVGRQVASVVDLVRPLVGARMDIRVDLPETPCLAHADVGQFETALVNLAVNARDAMDQEGLITIRVRLADALPAARGLPRRPGEFVAVSVIDAGGGIETDKLEAIFEPFYTTKEVGKGTGLGLSQVFGFAQQSDGEIEVWSAPGQGAVFTLYLRRAEAGAAPEPRLAQPYEARVHGSRVLVVEDNEAVGQFSTEMLHDLGYVTTWVSNAAEALDRLAETSGAFDLVFSDVIMPGMNGVDLARTVRDRYPTLPVVLTSGYSNVLAEEHHDGFELIKKPYSVEELAKVMRKAASRHAALMLEP